MNNEILIREVLVFSSAVAGAAWGYFFGKIVEHRRWASEVGPSLESLERWAGKLCHGLEGLERSLARSSDYVSENAAWDPGEAKNMLYDAKVGVPPVKPAGSRGLRGVISG